jgi:hypothetical protein
VRGISNETARADQAAGAVGGMTIEADLVQAGKRQTQTMDSQSLMEQPRETAHE